MLFIKYSSSSNYCQEEVCLNFMDSNSSLSIIESAISVHSSLLTGTLNYSSIFKSEFTYDGWTLWVDSLTLSIYFIIILENVILWSNMMCWTPTRVTTTNSSFAFPVGSIVITKMYCWILDWKTNKYKTPTFCYQWRPQIRSSC